MNKKHKTILITDGRGSCVPAIAAHLAEQGYCVAVNDYFGAGVPAGCGAVHADLSDFASVKNMVDSCGKSLWGVLHPAPPFEQASLRGSSEGDFQKAFREGALAALHVARAAGEALGAMGRGSVVFLGSIHAEKPTGCAPLYAMGCGAAQMLCREASQDYGTKGVSFHYVRRGVMAEDLALKNTRSNVYSAPGLQYPARRLPDPESLFGLMDYLFSGGAGILNGSDLCADGGMTLYYGAQFTDAELAEAAEKYVAAPPAVFSHPDAALSPVRGRVALITGGGKGVGAGIARVLCRAGMRVCIGWNSSEALALHTLKEIEEAGGEAFLYRADVSDREQLKAMAKETAARYGGIDLLVNNAAMQPNRFIRHYSDGLFGRVWDINIGGYWRALQECLPYLEKSACPRVVNISSIHGKRPTVFDPGYAMTKGAVRMFTREAALELAEKGITVNSVNLGTCRIEGKTGDYLFPLKKLPGTYENAGNPLGEVCSPEDVGFLVLYLAGTESGRMTGSGIRLDGGSMMV